MTCLVALEHEGISYLGCDSFMGNSFSRDQIDRPKFFTKGDRFVIGFAGDIRGAQIVAHNLKFRKRKPNEEEESYLVTEVSKKLHTAFTKAGINLSEDPHNDSGTCFLICLNGKIFVLQTNFSVIRSSHGYMAIGVGGDFALGALAAMESSNLDPKEKVQKSLEIATNLSPQVCGPYHIIEV